MDDIQQGICCQAFGVLEKFVGKTGYLLIAKGGIGLGGQAFSEIIFLQDKRAYEKFIAGVSLGPATDPQRATRYMHGMDNLKVPCFI